MTPFFTRPVNPCLPTLALQAYTESEGTRQYYVEVPRPAGPLGGALWHGADGVLHMVDRHAGEPGRSGDEEVPGSKAYAQRNDVDGWGAWLDSWKQKMDNWWGFLPVAAKPDMAACFGALGLHLASRLQSLLGEVFRADQLFAGPPPTATAAGVACDMMMENVKGTLPDFPDFPDATQFELPPLIPIPRLLPSELQLHSSLVQSGSSYLTTASSTEDDESASVQRVMINAAGGFAAGVALVALIGLAVNQRSQWRGGRLTMRRSKGPTTVEANHQGAQGTQPSVLTSR